MSAGFEPGKLWLGAYLRPLVHHDTNFYGVFWYHNTITSFLLPKLYKCCHQVDLEQTVNTVLNVASRGRSLQNDFQ